MNLKLFFLRLLAARLATNRRGAASSELDRAGLARQRIALVKLDGIGDFVLATGLLRLIRQELPEAQVTYFCRQPVGELVRQQFPEWSVVEVFNLRTTSKEILRDQNLRQRLKSLPSFDLLLDLRTFRNFDETTVASWIPARQKIGLENSRAKKSQGWLAPAEQRIFDQLLPAPRTTGDGLAGDLQNHRTLGHWLFPQTDAGDNILPHMVVDPAAREQVAALLAARFNLPREKPFLLVCPGTSTPKKEYPVPGLAEAILTAIATNPMPVVIAGSAIDERTTKPLHQRLQNDCEVIDVSGIFGLNQHLALISWSRAVLSMDSCHAHFAGAIGTPAVVILGGGQYGLFGPWGESPTFRWLTQHVPCFGCNWTCIHDRELCIQDIPTETIAKNLAEILSWR